MADKLDIKAFLDKDEQKDLLRFLTAGSVDDGKSTLIGRLLFDSKKLYEDQLDALERLWKCDKRHGTERTSGRWRRLCETYRSWNRCQQLCYE